MRRCSKAVRKPLRLKRSKSLRLVPRPRIFVAARTYRVVVDPDSPVRVALHVSRTKRGMLTEIDRMHGTREARAHRDAAGVCVVCQSTVTRDRRPKLWTGRLLAHVYLNVKDLRDRPSEIPAHEATHAAMQWCRFVGARPVRAGDPAEEVLAYAVGRITRGMVNALYRAGAYA